MKVLGLIVNLLLPGIGSFFFGKYGQAIAQFIIWFIGFLFTITGIFAIIGIPICIIAWGWALATSITALSAPDKREKYGHRLEASERENAMLSSQPTPIKKEENN